MSGLSNVLARRRRELGLTLAQIADHVGVTEATVQRWESGNIKQLKQENIVKLAAILKIHPGVLMGWFDYLPSEITTMPKMNQIPHVGDIACGTPILAEQNIDVYVDLPEHIRADYALTCHGDSMIGAGIHDGDMVYIRAAADVNNGEIAAVLIGDEATLKHVYHDDDGVTLVPDNPAYPPKHFSGQDAAEIKILGRAVAYTHSLI